MTEISFPEGHEALKIGLRAAYRIQRPAFPQKKSGELHATGADQAFNFVLGYLLAWHNANKFFANQSSLFFTLQVRGADEVAGLDKFGKELVRAESVN